MELSIGVVLANYDKDNTGKLKVKLQLADASGNEILWLPVLSPYAGGGYGLYCLPEKDDSVIVGFINGDPRSGVVLGSLWTKKNALPADCGDEKNEVKKLIVKNGHHIVFDDKEKGGLSVKTKAGLEITLSDENENVIVKDKNGKNKVTVNAKDGKVQLDADSDIVIKAGKSITLDGDITLKGKNITLDASAALALKGKDTKLDGSTVKINGTASTDVKGAKVNVESSAILTLKGSMTKIN